MAFPTNIYEYVLNEEQAYQTQEIPIVEGYSWNMFKHIKLSTLYKNSRYERGNSDDKPFKNIIRPILNVQYRTEGFDVKDIVPYVNSDKDYYKSFLIRKFHDKWARENDIDTFIDEVVESYVDYGGALVKNVNGVRPEVVPLQRLAFVDQTDILAGTICEKHIYSIDQLEAMKGKWYEREIDIAITMARNEKLMSQAGMTAKTPSRYIEVYEVHGTLPKGWLVSAEEEDRKPEDEKGFSRQIHIITFVKNSSEQKQGLCLFKGNEKTPIYKLVLRDKIYGRALGFGGIEELFESQVWTNYNEIQIKKILDKAALMLGITDDGSFAQRNRNINEVDTGEILEIGEGKSLKNFEFNANNLAAFENALVSWENHARTVGSATDAVLGLRPSSGTPFKLQDLLVQEGKSLHDWRRGKLATFISEIYRDWILKHLVSEINKGQKFVADLTLDELQEISDRVVTNYVNKVIKEQIVSGKVVQPADVELLRNKAKEDFMRGGTKRWIELMREELVDSPVDVEVNVAGKQKDLPAVVDKLTNIFRQIIATPQVLQDENMRKLFNQILEYSGLDPIQWKVSPPVPSPMQQLVTPNQLPDNAQ